MYSKLLIPLDGSKTAESVLTFVNILQDTPRIPIELLAVIDISQMTMNIAADKARYLDKFIAEGERTSEEYLRRVAASLKGFDVQFTVERGKPADVIIERAAAVAGTMISMATHGRSGVNRWLLGSVAEKVLRGTNCPLFLVRADADDSTAARSVSSIVVPLDGSAIAESILPAAVEMTRRLSAEIVLFRGYELPASAYYGSEDYLPNYDELKKQVKAEAQDYLNDQAQALNAKGLSRVKTAVAEGLAADEIIRCAREHPNSLLAMCTHGRSGVQRWVLGSVTETVVRHAPGPVLVQRAP
jgi:nucleotide-binding universal stress UspA family protein